MDMQRTQRTWLTLRMSPISKRQTVQRPTLGMQKSKTIDSGVFQFPLARNTRYIEEQERLAYEKHRYSKCINAIFQVLQVKSKGVRTLPKGFVEDVEADCQGPRFTEVFADYPAKECDLFMQSYDILSRGVSDKSGIAAIRMYDFLHTPKGRELVDTIDDREWLRQRHAKL